MDIFGIESLLLTVISLVLFAAKAWAFIDAISHRPEAFEATGKMTKPAWLLILGLTLLVHMLRWDPIGLLNLVGTVAAFVYLLDVRPALRSLGAG